MKKESEEHKNLKLLGRKILAGMGYFNTEIYEEERININGKIFIVDLIGMKNGFNQTNHRRECQKNTIIECGTSCPDKFQKIREDGYILLHLPYSEYKNNLLISQKAQQYLKILAKGLANMKIQYEEISRQNNILEEARDEQREEHLNQLIKQNKQFEEQMNETKEKYKTLEEMSQQITALFKVIRSFGNRFQ